MEKKKPDDEGWGRDKRPVINVSRDDAAAYCMWLSDKTRLNFKLPTEAQWENAARGTDQLLYPWGNSSPTCKKANYKACGNKTQPVGSYLSGQSPYGLMDMAGNVWEWCRNNPVFPPVRGGSWDSDDRDCRAVNRKNFSPSSRSARIGFRLFGE